MFQEELDSCANSSTLVNSMVALCCVVLIALFCSTSSFQLKVRRSVALGVASGGFLFGLPFNQNAHAAILVETVRVEKEDGINGNGGVDGTCFRLAFY